MDSSQLEAGRGFLAELRGGRADGTWNHSAGPVDRLTIAYSDVLRGVRRSATYWADRNASRLAGHAVMVESA
jgi:hypothetical protein